MGVLVPISLLVRLVALFFVLGMVFGLWVGLGGLRDAGGDRPMAPAVTTVIPPDHLAAR
ncbi:hypothetical protein [Actinophytocola xanthii]|uniref:hypothetical protein n=1 Tax=Actinophytocola xanthii TaxID=1912961 RepID=UPI0013019640|nr:hypothetical protein [Actinophytocola xanthii]